MRIRTFCCSVVILALFTMMAKSAEAAPIPVDPSITSLSVFDTGGMLNPAANGGYFLGGLEVDPGTGAVYVMATNTPPGGTTATVQLLRSTGLGTAATVGAPVPFVLNARGFDLTRHPVTGKLSVAGFLGPAGPGLFGIHGFDPAGVLPPATFAITTGGFATSGLTFDAAGTTALVSTDGAGTFSLPNGLYSVPAGGPQAPVVVSGPLPVGIGQTDDHVITKDGRTILAGDGNQDLWDVTGGAGSVSLLIDLTPIPGLAAEIGPAGGARATCDRCSGDIFYAHALSATSRGIIRIKADGSSASVFATGFMGIRDIDFGPSSSGIGESLYVTEFMPQGPSVGTIYEFQMSCVPEPTSCALAAIGLLWVAMRCRAARRS